MRFLAYDPADVMARGLQTNSGRKIDNIVKWKRVHLNLAVHEFIFIAAVYLCLITMYKVVTKF